jgi:hypothetical protein
MEGIGQEQLQRRREPGLVQRRRAQLEQEPAQAEVGFSQRLAGLQSRLARGGVR